jgi:hypothetical protein
VAVYTHWVFGGYLPRVSVDDTIHVHTDKDWLLVWGSVVEHSMRLWLHPQHVVKEAICRTGVLTRGFMLEKLTLYHLNHTSSPFCSGYFGDGVS